MVGRVIISLITWIDVEKKKTGSKPRVQKLFEPKIAPCSMLDKVFRLSEKVYLNLVQKHIYVSVI